MMAVGSIFLVYMVSWIMSFFGGSIPFIHEGGIIGIGFSLVVVVIAGLSLLLDLDSSPIMVGIWMLVITFFLSLFII